MQYEVGCCASYCTVCLQRANITVHVLNIRFKMGFFFLLVISLRFSRFLKKYVICHNWTQKDFSLHKESLSTYKRATSSKQLRRAFQSAADFICSTSERWKRGTGNSAVALCSFAAQPELQQLEGFLCVCSLKAVGLRNEGGINQRKERRLRVGDLVTLGFRKATQRRKRNRKWVKGLFWGGGLRCTKRALTVTTSTHITLYNGKRCFQNLKMKKYTDEWR